MGSPGECQDAHGRYYSPESNDCPSAAQGDEGTRGHKHHARQKEVMGGTRAWLKSGGAVLKPPETEGERPKEGEILSGSAAIRIWPEFCGRLFVDTRLDDP